MASPKNPSGSQPANRYEQALTDSTEVRGLTPAEKLVLLALAARANAAHGRPVGLTPADLAGRLGYQRKTINHALTKLEEAGYISRTPRNISTPTGGTIRKGEVVTFHYDTLRAARRAEGSPR